MKRFLLFIGCIALLALSGCSQETSLPQPTGKGSVRAINTILTSPGISFLIEERVIGDVRFKLSSTTQRWDDFSYVFNFEALFPGDFVRTRIASTPLDVVADTEYTFVITGALANPDITTWESELRTWDGTETFFAASFGHTTESLGALDIYFDAPDVEPVIGAAVGTIQFTEVTPELEIENGQYVLTIATAAGAATEFDPATIVYQSGELTLAGPASELFSIFAADGNDVSPYSVRKFDIQGNGLTVPDARFLPTIQFVQAAMGLLPADIYDDDGEPPTNRIVSNHVFTDYTADIPIQEGLVPLTYTAVDNVSVTLYEVENFIINGAHNRFVMLGADPELIVSLPFLPDRRSVETFGKFEVMNASVNFPLIDVYLVEGNLGITDRNPRLFALDVGAPPVTVTLGAASYEMYVTSIGDKTILAGPIPLDVALGDIIDVTVLDTAEATSVQALFIPSP
jgi:hypothetical protein